MVWRLGTNNVEVVRLSGPNIGTSDGELNFEEYGSGSGLTIRWTLSGSASIMVCILSSEPFTLE